MALFEDTTKVIFTSSIGVYPKLEGNFDESYVFSAKDALNSIFLAEKAILAIARNKSVLLRLGGLISKQRHPIRYLAGKSVPEDGTAPVNLVHHQDVVRFVLLAIQNFQPGIYNLVANINLNKQEYYTEAAQHFGLPYPVFGQLPDINRCVSGELVKLKFGFTYSYSPLDWNSFTK